MGRRQGHDPGRRATGRPAPCWSRSRTRLRPPQVRLFHTSVTRANATWPIWPGEPGFTGTFEDFVAERSSSSQAGDFAVLEAGIVSEETYVEQGLYWETGHRPLIRYVLDRYKPDVALVGYPVTDEFQHQFLGLITRRLPNGARNPAYDDVQVNGTPDGRVDERKAFIRRAYKGADATMRLAQDRMNDRDHDLRVVRPRLRAAVPGDRRQPGARRPRPAVAAADLQLPRGDRRDDRQGEGVPAGGAVQIYLNLAGREPAGGGLTQVPANQEAIEVARIKAAFLALRDPNDWTGDGQPGWKVIDRAFTKAEARVHPERRGPDRRHGAPDAPATSWRSRIRRTSSTRRRPAR